MKRISVCFLSLFIFLCSCDKGGYLPTESTYVSGEREDLSGTDDAFCEDFKSVCSDSLPAALHRLRR